MKFKTYVTEDAEADIRNASIWYDEQSPGLGDRFLRAYEYSKNSIQETSFCLSDSGIPKISDKVNIGSC